MLQYSVVVRNAKLDAVETQIGTSPMLEIRTGPPPANCAAADSGTLLVQIPLPSDWMAAASAASKAKTGTWSGTAVGTGTARHFRIKDSGSPDTTHIQGNIEPNTGSPDGDMELDNVSIAASQTVTVNSFTLTAGNS